MTRLLQRAELGLFAVAHGLGKSAVAAELTVEVLAETVEASALPNERLTPESARTLLLGALRDLQEAWRSRVETDAALAGIGAAVVVALLTPGGVTIAHLGDCAALLLRGGHVLQRTLNHSLRRDILDKTGQDPGPGKLDAIIVRAVTAGTATEPEVQHWEVRPDDMVLLTSGVHDLLSEAEIGAQSCPDPKEFARRLVRKCNERQFQDDFAVVALRPGGHE